MLRPLIALALFSWRKIGACAQAHWQMWDRFWFEPQHPATLGLLRIFAGSMILYTHVVWGLELQAFFGSSGWQDPLLVQSVHKQSVAMSFWSYVPETWNGPVHGVCLFVLSLFTLGLFTRCTSILTFLIVVSYAHRAPLANFGLDQINAMLALYLAIGPSGTAFSLDRLWQRFREAKRAASEQQPLRFSSLQKQAAARLAGRLIQVHMCILYFWAGHSKLKGESWWTGEAIWFAAANTEYRSGDLTWLAWYPLLGNFISHATIFFETTYWIFVFNPRYKWAVLAAGIGMHLGIGMFMGMWTFGLVMIFTYISYIPADSLYAAWGKFGNLLTSGKKLTLSYQPHRAWDRWSVALRCALSLTNQIELCPRDADDRTTGLGLPVTPGSWWNSWKNSPPVPWPFPSPPTARTDRAMQLVVVDHKLERQIALQQYFTRHHYYSRMTPDVALACACLSSKPADCVILFVEDDVALEEATAFQCLCERSPDEAPATVMVVGSRLRERIEIKSQVKHRVLPASISSRELRQEIILALQRPQANVSREKKITIDQQLLTESRRP